MNKNHAESITDIALKAGSIVLENGGETYRTEDTIMRIASSLGAVSPSSFVTPTVVMLSFTDTEGNHHSAMRRIKQRGVNLRKVALINALSRRLEKRKKADKAADFLQTAYTLERIHRSPKYPVSAVLFCAALSSLCFAFMFGGTFKDALAASVIGLILRLIVIKVEKISLNVFFLSFLYGGIISIFTELIFLCGYTGSPIIITSAVLMQVVPGLAIVNAIRDIIAGDLVSGAARALEAFMIAAGLSLGSVLGLFAFSGITGVLL
ncbi:threonine/serine exporter family protein [Treponema sp. OMZ 840]|uniref:threonine/serine exporter family protein n=1 Tax=Treponema sp. OMZ 840 TaxID=244313 RepID=UPI003D92D03E